MIVAMVVESIAGPADGAVGVDDDHTMCFYLLVIFVIALLPLLVVAVVEWL